MSDIGAINNGTFFDAERAPLASAPDAERAIPIIKP